jgi:hypothetical protein
VPSGYSPSIHASVIQEDLTDAQETSIIFSFLDLPPCGNVAGARSLFQFSTFAKRRSKGAKTIRIWPASSNALSHAETSPLGCLYRRHDSETPSISCACNCRLALTRFFAHLKKFLPLLVQKIKYHQVKSPPECRDILKGNISLGNYCF